MLLINCPHCNQDRDEAEFSYGGEAHKPRPTDPAKLDDQEWSDFLYLQRDSKGLFLERWNHAAGCRRWFNMARDTTTSEIVKIYKMGEKAPKLNRTKPEY
ncbi:MAG: sarcosine oxidase subunit delta [Alphaproteobacteria bacterium]